MKISSVSLDKSTIEEETTCLTKVTSECIYNKSHNQEILLNQNHTLVQSNSLSEQELNSYIPEKNADAVLGLMRLNSQMKSLSNKLLKYKQSMVKLDAQNEQLYKQKAYLQKKIRQKYLNKKTSAFCWCFK